MASASEFINRKIIDYPLFRTIVEFREAGLLSDYQVLRCLDALSYYEWGYVELEQLRDQLFDITVFEVFCEIPCGLKVVDDG